LQSLERKKCEHAAVGTTGNPVAHSVQYKEEYCVYCPYLGAAEALTMKEGEGKLKTSFALTPGMEHSMLDRQASISSGI
jgi:hypothetical protein